jgi:short-subunit dehydrogenase
MLDGAMEAGVEHFIYVSSASALEPRGSLYAATKAAGKNWSPARNACTTPSSVPTWSMKGTAARNS